MRRPGIEPGSTAWKAAMLTIIPPTHSWRMRAFFPLYTHWQGYTVGDKSWTNHVCLYSSVAERWSCKPKVMSSILIGGKFSFPLSVEGVQKFCDPDVIRTRSLLIWSQTRYRCATESTVVRSYRDLNSDRWIQSPEC